MVVVVGLMWCWMLEKVKVDIMRCWVCERCSLR